MFRREGSIPVNEAAVDRALEMLKNQPGGILHVTKAVLDQLAQTMAAHDFADLKLDVADAKWLADNADRLDKLPEGQMPRDRFRGLP